MLCKGHLADHVELKKNYNFVVKYKPGKVHTDVDVLSKLILDESEV